MTYTLTNTLTNLTPGNITLNLSADSGYELPAQADITVTGGSIVSYNQSTGALVVTGDTTAVEVECAVSAAWGGTDLTGTTWEITSTTCVAGYGQFDVLGSVLDENGDIPATGSDMTGFYIGYTVNHPRDGAVPGANSIVAKPDGPTFVYVGYSVSIGTGTDVTNSSLITWLQANATLISW